MLQKCILRSQKYHHSTLSYDQCNLKILRDQEIEIVRSLRWSKFNNDMVIKTLLHYSGQAISDKNLERNFEINF